VSRTVSALLVAFSAALCASPSVAAECSAHFPFDGSLTDIVGSRNGQLITAEGGAGTREFVDGHNGRALQLGRGTAMRAFIDLHPQNCPQLTIAAWVRVDTTDESTRLLVSTGQVRSPGLRITTGSDLRLNGSPYGLWETDVFRNQGGWTFIAGVYDFEQGTYTLHWRGRSSGPQELGDSYLEPDEAIWVGALNDDLKHPANGVAIDELQVFPRALDAGQLAELRQTSRKPPRIADATSDDRSTAPADGGNSWQGSICSSHDECGSGEYCGQDDRCHPDQHAPKAPGPEFGTGGAMGGDLATGPGKPDVATGGASGGDIASQAGSGSDFSTGGASGGDVGSGVTLESMRERDSLSPGMRDAISERVEENQPPELAYESEEAAEEAQRERERRAEEAAARNAWENEQLPAPTIDAVIDLQTLDVVTYFERDGDEYYLVRYPLRGRLGTGDRIYTFDYAEQVWPIVAGENWAKPDKEFSIPQGAGRFVFENLAPFEVYGFVAVLMNANRSQEEALTNAFGFGEFENEAGVTEVISSAFARAVPRDIATPDYSDTSCANVQSIYEDVTQGLSTHFGDYRRAGRGLREAIRVALVEPLSHNNRDQFFGAMWAFAMNFPGGERGWACMTSYNDMLFPPGRSPMMFDFDYVKIFGEHRQ